MKNDNEAKVHKFKYSNNLLGSFLWQLFGDVLAELLANWGSATGT